MKIKGFFILFLFALTTAKAQAPASINSAELLHQMKKLNTVGSVLYIAAHPDDENTRLLAYLANEKKIKNRLSFFNQRRWWTKFSW
jgi:hypothetical protein